MIPPQAAITDYQQQSTKDAEVELSKTQYRTRMVTKYLIDALCYPLLLASTRMIIMHDDPSSTWQHMCSWRKEEGALSLFGGVCASLVCNALDEVMDWVLGWCIDYCAKDSDMEIADRILLKASGSSVVSIFTSPVSYVGVIQRCQSSLPRLPDPESVPEMVKTLPWRGCVYQFFLYGGIMAINVRLIQMKMQLRDQDY